MRERYERDKSVTIAPFQLTETPCPPGEILYCIYDANRLSPPKDYDEEQCAAWIAEKVAGDDATRCEPPEAAETPESQLFAEQILYFPCNAPPFADAGGANSPYLISGSQEACGVPWYAFLPIRTERRSAAELREMAGGIRLQLIQKEGGRRAIRAEVKAGSGKPVMSRDYIVAEKLEECVFESYAVPYRYAETENLVDGVKDTLNKSCKEGKQGEIRTISP